MLGDLHREAALFVLLPELRDQARGGHDIGCRDQHDVPLQGLADKIRRGVQRGVERGFDRYEEEDKVRRIDAGQIRVVFRRQLLDVPAQGTGMFLRRRRAFLVAGRAALAFVGDERDLGVDDQLPAAGQIEHHVGLQAPATFAGGRDLGAEMLAFDQPRFFQHRLEDHLAPVAAGFRLTLQGLSEVARFA